MTSYLATDVSQVLRCNLRDVDFKPYWVAEERIDTRFKSSELILCLVEHLDNPASDENRQGFEVALLDREGRHTLLAGETNAPWKLLINRCADEGIQLEPWFPSDLPDSVVDARRISDPPQVQHWHPTLW